MTSRHHPKIFCSECGAKATGSCGCGATYVQASVAAANAIAKMPDLSDRAIAAATQIPHSTIQRARKSNPTDPKGTVEKRVGLDGRARRMPTPRHDNPSHFERKHVAATINLIQRLAPILHAMKRELKFHGLEVSPQTVNRLAYELLREIFEHAGWPMKTKVCERLASQWEIPAKLKEEEIDGVGATARAWSDLHKRMLAAAAAAQTTEAEPVTMREAAGV